MDRVSNQVLDVLSGILIKNIDLSYLGFVTFSHVDVAPDLRSAKVYYSVLGRKKSNQEICLDHIQNLLIEMLYLVASILYQLSH